MEFQILISLTFRTTTTALEPWWPPPSTSTPCPRRAQTFPKWRSLLRHWNGSIQPKPLQRKRPSHQPLQCLYCGEAIGVVDGGGVFQRRRTDGRPRLLLPLRVRSGHDRVFLFGTKMMLGAKFEVFRININVCGGDREAVGWERGEKWVGGVCHRGVFFSVGTAGLQNLC